ncbi:hypothetical protein KJ865_15120, partial [Myxococcota bacterium]|nr:hypothetical protein [Myxococcota bacterium]
MALLGTQLFENFIAYRYLKADKFRISIVFAAVMILLAFGTAVTSIYAFNPSVDLASRKLTLTTHNFFLLGVLALQVLILIISSLFVQRKLLYFTAFFLLALFPLLIFFVTLKLQPLLVPRIGFYLRYFFMGELVLGCLVLLFGVILLFFNVYSTTS